MKLRSFFAALVFILLAATAWPQASAGSNEGSQLSRDPLTGAYTFSWWGRAGRTYFLQQSDDLATWTYLPVIESGAEQPIQWGFTSTAPRFFVRLKYTDIATTDPFNADFDGDGVSNWNELLQGTDPFVAALDTNGLPLDWEKFYNIPIGADPSSLAPRSDGLTYLQAFQQGLNPNSSEGEYLPVLAVVGGSNQSGSPGSILPTPLSIQVFAPKKYTAPLTFTVSAGTALLSTNSAGSNPAGTVTVQAATPWVNQNGSTVYVAQVYVCLPAASARISTINVTAPSGTQTTSVSTQVFAFDPNVQPPSGLAVGRVDATTADLSWTPADPTLPTNVEVSHDYGYTWSRLTSFDPGVTTGSVQHLTPDQQVTLRLYTGSSGGGGGSSGTNAVNAADSAGGGSGSGSVPSTPVTFTPLSVPVVIGAQAFTDARNYTYPGFQTPSNRYLKVQTKTSVPDFDHANPCYSADLFNSTYIVEYGMQEWYLWWQGIPQYTYIDLDGSNIATIGTGLVVSSDTEATFGSLIYYGDLAYYSDGNHSDLATDQYHYMVKYTLSQPYNSLSQFVSDVESQASDYRPQFTGDTAKISLTEDVGVGEADADLTAQISIPPSYDHRYIITKLKYSFNCNPDPNGVVVYDIVFTPDDGSDTIHDVHVLPTNGKTQVPDAPITLDPTLLNNKQNGTYRVIPIAFQPDNWTDPPANGGSSPQTNAMAGTNDIAPDQGQTGVTGAMVASTLGNSGQKHFVSPKQPGGFVVLRAELPKNTPAVDFAANFEWVQAPAGRPQYQMNGNKISVPRDTPGKYPIQIKAKKGGAIIDVMNVWVVWDMIAFDEDNTAFEYSYPEGVNGGQTGAFITSGYSAVHTIVPPNIITDLDRPDLSGVNESSVPEGTATHFSTTSRTLSQGVNSKWDPSQQVRAKVLNPNGIQDQFLGRPSGQATPSQQPTDYPKDPLVGNDDIYTNNGSIDPYAHGVISIQDSPSMSIADAAGNEGDTYEWRLQFLSFGRLEIAKVWYVISDYYPWRVHLKMKKSSGKWISDMVPTDKAQNNDGY